MALFDKVKAQATQLAQKAQEAGKAGQAKLEDVQARRRADGLLRDLGAVLFAQRVGRPVDGPEAQIETLVAQVRSLEQEHGFLVGDGLADATAPNAPDSSEEGPEGGFTLEP